jgi:hypothetical protein
MSHMFAAMWDCNGLEAIVDVTERQQQRAWAMLKGIRNPPVEVPNLMHWQLRAQANPQRHYEIYILEVEEGITVEDVRMAFEADPQEMADTVRRIGHKFYSDRAPEKVRIK